MKETHEPNDGMGALFAEGGIFHLLVHGRHDGIWCVDASGRSVYYNEALPGLLGCSEHTLRTANLSDFLSPEDRPGLMTAVRGGAVVRGRHLRLKLPGAHGERRWFGIESMPTHSVPGGSPGALLIIADATAQRRGEEARAHLSALVETSDDAILSMDLSHQITSWNPGAERLFGYARDQALGKDAAMLVPTDTVAAESRLYERMDAGEPIENHEFVGLKKDGSRIELSLTATPVFDAGDDVVGFALVVRDLTTRHRVELLQDRLAAIVESSDDAIVSKDLDGIIQSWNGGAERLFGYSAEEAIGRSMTLLLPPDRYDEERRILERLRRGEKTDHLVTTRLTKDGRLVDVFVSVSPVHNGRGETIGASAVSRDVSDLMAARRERDRWTAELENRVEERTKELRAAVAELESFAHAASHDLRAPLRTVELCRRTIREEFGEAIPDEVQRSLERQAGAVERMNGLINDLLNYASLSRAEFAPHDLNVTNLARRTWDEITRDMPEGEMRFHVQESMRAQGDPILVRCLLQSLLRNAVKFSSAKGAVYVGQETDGSFYVRDEGVGFEMQYAGKLFQPFQRLVRASQFPGTGLGLASVRRIVERHHGRVWAESRPGEGATFRFTLSVEAASSATESRPAA